MGIRSQYVMVPEDDPLFCRFWNAYPKHVAKKDARKAFAKLNPTPALVDQMVETLAWQIPLHKWDRDKYDYCPYPASWLNGRRFEDKPPVMVSSPTMSAAASLVFDALGVKL